MLRCEDCEVVVAADGDFDLEDGSVFESHVKEKNGYFVGLSGNPSLKLF